MKNLVLGGLLLALLVSGVSANMAVSANQVVVGQPVVINAECLPGATCTVMRDSVMVWTLVGDSYGTVSVTDYPPLGSHTYAWSGRVYGFAGTLVDHAQVLVVPNDADSVGGKSAEELMGYADAAALNAPHENMNDRVGALERRVSVVEADSRELTARYAYSSFQNGCGIREAVALPNAASQGDYLALHWLLKVDVLKTVVEEGFLNGGHTGYTAESCWVIDSAFLNRDVGKNGVFCAYYPAFQFDRDTNPCVLNASFSNRFGERYAIEKAAKGEPQLVFYQQASFLESAYKVKNGGSAVRVSVKPFLCRIGVKGYC